jgi:nitrogen regulatory protein PII
MKRLSPEKLLAIIGPSALTDTLTEMLRRNGISGYTLLQASGAGTSGPQTGMLDIDSNIMLYVILSEERVPALLDEIERLMRKGHHLKAFVSDAAVLAIE